MAINVNECTEMLKAMFRDNQLTQSTITAVVTEKKGDLDLCVGKSSLSFNFSFFFSVLFCLFRFLLRKILVFSDFRSDDD